MYLSELKIRNFRIFGENDKELTLVLTKGITAIVGQNDAGKSAIVDAIRYALLTRDQEFIRVQPEDFHVDSSGKQASEIYIRCMLSDFNAVEKGALAEYLTYKGTDVVLYVNWTARTLGKIPGERGWLNVSVSSGIDGTGLSFELPVRQMLSAAYLRPLRDAESEMSSGRCSRLSQILANVPEIKTGQPFDCNNPPADSAAVCNLSLPALYDYMRFSVEKHPGIGSAECTINIDYLAPISLEGCKLNAKISFADGGSELARLRQILERLELALTDTPEGTARGITVLVQTTSCLWLANYYSLEENLRGSLCC